MSAEIRQIAVELGPDSTKFERFRPTLAQLGCDLDVPWQKIDVGATAATANSKVSLVKARGLCPEWSRGRAAKCACGAGRQALRTSRHEQRHSGGRYACRGRLPSETGMSMLRCSWSGVKVGVIEPRGSHDVCMLRHTTATYASGGGFLFRVVDGSASRGAISTCLQGAVWRHVISLLVALRVSVPVARRARRADVFGC